MNAHADDNHQLEILFGRRSIRVYSPGAVSDEEVQTLLEAAMAAPSAMAKDPWRFVDIAEKETLAKLATLLPGGSMLATCSRAILVAGDLDATLDRHLSYLLQDCSAAIENLLIAAHAFGLGACWVGVHPYQAGIDRLQQLFVLPASVIPVAVISLGIPGENPGPRTRFRQEFVHKEKW